MEAFFMKSSTFWKITGVIVTLAIIAFIVVRYGDKIVAWTKKTWARLGFSNNGVRIFDEDNMYNDVSEDVVHADDADFAG